MGRTEGADLFAFDLRLNRIAPLCFWIYPKGGIVSSGVQSVCAESIPQGRFQRAVPIRLLTRRNRGGERQTDVRRSGSTVGCLVTAAGRLVNFLRKGYDHGLVESVGMLTTGAGWGAWNTGGDPHDKGSCPRFLHLSHFVPAIKMDSLYCSTHSKLKPALHLDVEETRRCRSKSRPVMVT